MIFKWKISVLGDPSVGKTSLVRHYCEGYFRENYLSTIGVSFLKKSLDLRLNNDIHKIILQIWDLGGQIIFSNVRNNYLHGTNGALILFDLTEIMSLNHVANWYEEIISAVGKIPVLIIGNKMDLPYKNSTLERAKRLCSELNIEFYITSAKTGDNMNKIFERLAELLYIKLFKKD